MKKKLMMLFLAVGLIENIGAATIHFKNETDGHSLPLSVAFWSEDKGYKNNSAASSNESPTSFEMKETMEIEEEYKKFRIILDGDYPDSEWVAIENGATYILTGNPYGISHLTITKK